jgi:signal peptidase I
VSILIFLVLNYLLTSFMLMKVFEKAGIAPSKALIPGVNFVEWAKLVGHKPSFAAWMLFPVVNIFIWCGLCVDTMRSFGRYSFIDSALSVICAPLAFWQIGNNKDDKYLGGIVPREAEFQAAVKTALDKKDKFALNKLETSPYAKSPIREWTEAIFFAVFAAAFIRMFVFEMFVIPTSSMEGSLLVGDYLAVGKFNYGLRTPMTVIQVPLVHNQLPITGSESYLSSPSLPYFRLPAFEKIEHNSPIVFNWPYGDSIVMAGGRSWNVNQLRLMGQRFPADDVVARPIDKKDHYIKRCVGLPNDNFEIKDRQIYINGQAASIPSKVQFHYKVTGGINIEKMKEWGVNINDLGQGAAAAGHFTLNQEQLDKVNAMGGGVKTEIVPQNDPRLDIFPFDTAHYKWTVDNFGPLKIPAVGVTVQLSNENIALYSRIIVVYEGNKLETKVDGIYINGVKTTSYTFRQNYYWMQGDNRHNSEDSRFWGFVPEDHIVGKPLFIWFSKGEDSGIRWNRIFTSANKM